MYFFKILMIAMAFICYQPIQSKADVNITIGLAPDWGPVGYPDVRYYYIPDVEAYYDRNWGMFVYKNNGIWINRFQLPLIYRNYDLYHAYKVVMVGYNGKSPYKNHNSYKLKYPKGYSKGVQKTMKPNPKGKAGKSNNSTEKKDNSKGNSKKDNSKTDVKKQSNGTEKTKTQVKPKSESKVKSGANKSNQSKGGGNGKK